MAQEAESAHMGSATGGTLTTAGTVTRCGSALQNALGCVVEPLHQVHQVLLDEPRCSS